VHKSTARMNVFSITRDPIKRCKHRASVVIGAKTDPRRLPAQVCALFLFAASEDRMRRS